MLEPAAPHATLATAAWPQPSMPRISAAGRAAEAREVLRTLEGLSREKYVPPYAMALVTLGLGDKDATFEWLDRAFRARDVHLIFLTVDPKWDPLRQDPRFKSLLDKCGFAVVHTR